LQRSYTKGVSYAEFLILTLSVFCTNEELSVSSGKVGGRTEIFEAARIEIAEHSRFVRNLHREIVM